MQNGDRNDPGTGPGQEQDELQTLIERSHVAVLRADALISALQARYEVGQVARPPLGVEEKD